MKIHQRPIAFFTEPTRGRAWQWDFAACLQHAEHGSEVEVRFRGLALHSQDKEKDKAELSQSTFKNSQEHKGCQDHPTRIPKVGKSRAGSKSMREISPTPAKRRRLLTSVMDQSDSFILWNTA